MTRTTSATRSSSTARPGSRPAPAWSFTGEQAILDSFTPELSADGRFLVFTSFASNLVTFDDNEGSDVFVRDLQASMTTRVSEYTGGFQVDGDSQRPSISADGRYVAFDSDAWNLVWGDTNDVFDVYVHDRQTGATTRVSVDDSGLQSDGASFRPSLSGDGRSSRTTRRPRTSSPGTRTAPAT